MQDVTIEFEGRLQQASTGLSLAMDAALQEFRTRLMEADMALTAAMNSRLAVLRGEAAGGEEIKPNKTLANPPPPWELPPATQPASLDENERLRGLFPRASGAILAGQPICEFPNCECEGLVVPIGSLPTLDQCPRVAIYEASAGDPT